MINPRLDWKIPLAAAAAAMSIANSVLAEDQLLQEVTVTAQKREQSLSSVGISVTAFSGEQMKALGVSSTGQISEQTPGLIVTDFGGGTTTVFTIRGSGQLDFNDQQEAPVAVYLDGAYQSFLAGVGFNFYDLERVEVLRGSQGTLFGRNATGGLVQILTKKPTDKLEGYVDLTGGDYGMKKAEGAINLPVSETVAARVSLFHESNDGYIRNLTGKRGGDKDNNSGRVQMLFKPSDDLSILASGRFAVDHSQGQVYSVRAGILDAEGNILAVSPYGPVSQADYVTYCTNLISFNGVAPPAGGTNPGSDDCYNAQPNQRSPFQASTNDPSFFNRHQYEGTLTIDYKTGPGTLTSVTDYQDFKKRYSEDADSTPLTLWAFQQDVDATQFSQELRFAAETQWGRYIVGGYYLQIRNSGRASLDAVRTLGVGFQNFFSLDTRTYAAFGQLEYNFSPAWTGIIGIRGTGDEKKFALDVGCAFDYLANSVPTAADCSFFAPLIQGTGLPKTKRSEKNWSGNIELDWKPDDSTLVYGKVVRGHKAGGFNGGIINFFLPEAATYGPELPLTFETGLKASFFDKKARLNAAVFYTDYKGFQTFTQNGANLVVFNVDAKMTGAELEVVLNPWKGWDILLGTSLLDAKQKKVFGPGGALDRPMPNAPHVTYNALARYHWDAFGGQLSIQADMNHRGSRSLSAIDQPGLHGAAYTLVNANVGWSSNDDRWSVSLWGKNLSNKVYFPTVFDLTGITGQIEPVVAPPRWFGAALGYKF